MPKERHELEVIIDKQGQVSVEVKGAKGHVCLDYVEIFEEAVGRVKNKRLTAEYYEPPTAARITDSEKARTHTKL
jgi:hypothetical protein